MFEHGVADSDHPIPKVPCNQTSKFIRHIKEQFSIFACRNNFTKILNGNVRLYIIHKLVYFP